VAAEESFLRPDARFIGHAVAPVNPASLSPILLLIACLAAGLIASAAVIRVVVHFEPGFSRVRDIERATGISVLSAVPKFMFSGQQSFDRFADSIDMLLGRIMMGKSSGRGIVLTVTSCLPGEGKTTVTLALAHLAARIGYKCLVIDGDFRTRRITHSLGLQASSGLADVLDHSRKLDEVTIQRSDPALYVLPAGLSTHGIGRLLGSDSFRSMIHGLTHEYDLIIIDSSPLTAAAEPQILAQIADQTLMVVRWKKTPRATIQDAIERLSKGSGVICGIALSQVNSGRFNLKSYGDA
jgi:polysaccharide biosynthesis transport protein